MRLDQAVGVDLRSASLCIELDCNTIFDGTTYRHCPRCGNAECYPLAMWLDRAVQVRDATRAPRLAVGGTPPSPAHAISPSPYFQEVETTWKR